MTSHDTGPHAIMNASSFCGDLLATGQEDQCKIYKIVETGEHSVLPSGKLMKIQRYCFDFENYSSYIWEITVAALNLTHFCIICKY